MNLLQAHPSSALRSLPSARTLALMALRLDSREPSAHPLAGAAMPADAAGPGWFESSFELSRGLSVLEGTAGLVDERDGFNPSGAWHASPWIGR